MDIDQHSLRCIFGCHGARLNANERALFQMARPWGFILFARNCHSADQIRALIDDMHSCVGYAAPVLIDQEGGRVARLRPPIARAWPAAYDFVETILISATPPSTRLSQAKQAMHARNYAIALELHNLGIGVNCAPLADVPSPRTHLFLRDRLYANTPLAISALAAAAANGLLAGGVLPVVKHIPGHGKATVDSHHHLPIVHDALKELEAQDFMPFRALAHYPLAMTAHIVFNALDTVYPVTLSAKAVRYIRDSIGFHGILISDDLGMQALSVFGSVAECAKRALHAGCDLALECSGDWQTMDKVAAMAAHESTRACASVVARSRAAFAVANTRE